MYKISVSKDLQSTHTVHYGYCSPFSSVTPHATWPEQKSRFIYIYILIYIYIHTHTHIHISCYVCRWLVSGGFRKNIMAEVSSENMDTPPHRIMHTKQITDHVPATCTFSFDHFRLSVMLCAFGIWCTHTHTHTHTHTTDKHELATHIASEGFPTLVNQIRMNTRTTPWGDVSRSTLHYNHIRGLNIFRIQFLQPCVRFILHRAPLSSTLHERLYDPTASDG